ncbi:MFS transporter [Prosthecochloris sp. ZM_2]|uniref:MFS transporter n=1 Tax=Prosthecochloris sp. ZM_2 TaxID=2045206 RepID=UPI000DF81E08|nr:MFS transporter [Prosthecochloris sp. ZM_2]RNA65819.1 MFS transporter [Prosthecochloris sp. ZM_2]
MMVTFAFPLYFKNIVCEGRPEGDALWGGSVSLSMLIVALISPFLGAAADFSGRRKRFLLVFTALAVLCSALLGLTGPGMAYSAAALFVLANIGFEGGQVFYDAYLPDIASRRSIGRVSGYGYAMGYLGALSILLLLFPLLSGGVVPTNSDNIRLGFVLVALFFAVFAAPLFLVLRDENRIPLAVKDFRRSFSEVRYTVMHIMKYPDLARFLLAFFFYNDAILTVIAFSSIYAQNTLGFTTAELVGFFMIVQTTAIAGSVIFGILTDRIGPKRTIVLTLCLWCVVVIMAILSTEKSVFFATGLLAGVSMGSSQSASRAMMARLTPPKHVTEFFGFYDGTFGKASAIIGPVFFGMISSGAGGQRIALASLLLFFGLGLWFILRVRSATTRTGGEVFRDA